MAYEKPLSEHQFFDFRNLDFASGFNQTTAIFILRPYYDFI